MIPFNKITETLLFAGIKKLTIFINFPHEYQKEKMDCGPTSVKVIAKYFGRDYSLPYLKDLCGMTREGVSFLGLIHACEKIGFRTLASEAGMQEIKSCIALPCIVHWNESHFVVV